MVIAPPGRADLHHPDDVKRASVAARPIAAGQAPGGPARIGKWIEVHTDQVIIFGSPALGLCLVGNSIYLIVT